MTFTSVGYDGTVIESGWAKLAPACGSNYAIRAAADMLVTVKPAADRTLRVAVGSSYGHGVYDISGQIEEVQLDVLASGVRHDMIVIRRDWAGVGGATSIAVIKGGASGLVLPSRNNNPGTLDDQPIALVKVAGNGGGGVIDAVSELRCWVGTGGAIARDILALQYLSDDGSQVRIGDILWTRVLDGNLTASWSPAEAVPFAIGAALDGSAGPQGQPVRSQSGVTPIQANAFGDASVGFAAPFGAGLLSATFSVAAGVGAAEPVMVDAVMWSAATTNAVMRPSRTGFFVRLYHPGGTPWPWARVDVPWDAKGWN